MAQLSPQDRLRVLANAYTTAQNKEPILAEIQKIQNSLNMSQSGLPSNPSPAMQRQQEAINRRTSQSGNVPNFPQVQITPQDIAAAQAEVANYTTQDVPLNSVYDAGNSVPVSRPNIKSYDEKLADKEALQAMITSDNVVTPGTREIYDLLRKPLPTKTDSSWWERATMPADPSKGIGAQFSINPTIRKMYDMSNWAENNG